MEKKTKSWWSMLNPLEWIAGFFQLIAAVFGPWLRWLGMLTPPSTEGFQNIRKEDVEDAAKLATEQEAAVDAIVREMSPAEIVRAFANADIAGRASMDLSALDFDQQDWLLRLSDEDLDKLGMSTTAACGWSLEKKMVLPRYRKPPAEIEAPEVLQTPSAEEIEDRKREYVAERFRQIQRELWLAPGVPNLKPQHTPATLH
ncbi:hypothetical protein [Sinorhizobium meliloti]|uniref:hypothetical protein n=1 Tax=Rhizobium meliloti TaxID=382 RepID=UPI000FE01658|nr:hypothetical protein [Sinorhizobium meliloti]RVG70925.1 hypothetical protein CN222_01955 [Sinorhizobium meliloti]